MSVLNICILLVVILACKFVSGAFLQAGQCPPPNKVYNDKPTCFSDADCQKWGKVCCRNQHNTMSCTDRAPWRNNIDNNNKYSGGGGGGVYCDGVKCKPYEVCKPDRYTKRLKCQRA